MKFNIEIDCTPEEARSFFGLPDVKPMQAAVMQKVEQQMLDALARMSPEALLKTWAPGAPWTPAQMQELMATMLNASFGRSRKE
ncbi:DUF6489 family protein [Roseomonas sp. E05]|uniref:DUF6489 family protein n=1 Tax=Roseomonas sp. E05 TaxID=3046310 RepID=UPI0024BAEF0D|nr:DUF6489 family protein [Roseomonas sp. E05]MDJ0390597.1 DUF6489 family protein [Roseomonas sp. E05]